jgi:hypothetical protein
MKALNALRCGAAGLILLHATDLNPLWLIEPYRHFVNGLIFANQLTSAIFLFAVALSVATLMNCSIQLEACQRRT